MKLLPALALLFALPAPATAADKAAAKPAEKTEQLWQEWYLVTSNGNPIGYFEETAERRGAEKQISITQKWVEKIGGKVESYVGSVADDFSLRPVAFFVDRKAPSEEKSYKVDARVKGGKLEITFKPASAALAKSTEITALTPSMVLSSFTGLAVARHFKAKGPLSFTAIVEDGGDMNVELRKGTAEVGKEEKKFGKDKCRQATVLMGGKAQEWWVSAAGKSCLIVFPDSGTRMELTTEALAKKALGG